PCRTSRACPAPTWSCPTRRSPWPSSSSSHWRPSSTPTSSTTSTASRSWSSSSKRRPARRSWPSPSPRLPPPSSISWPPSRPAWPRPRRRRAKPLTTVEVGGRQLTLSNLDKVMYPASGFTKGQVIEYYAKIAPVMVPHLAGRPITLKRYPNGVDSQFFYEKNCPKHRPPWVETATVWSGGNNRDMYYCLCQDLPTLVWLAPIATLAFHTSLSYADKLPEPRTLVFDLDPGPPATIVECCRIGLMLRDL